MIPPPPRQVRMTPPSPGSDGGQRGHAERRRRAPTGRTGPIGCTRTGRTSHGLLQRAGRGRRRRGSRRRRSRRRRSRTSSRPAPSESKRIDRTAFAPMQRRVLDHPVDRLAAGVLEELGVLVDLAADERAQPGRQVAGQASAADDEAEHLALRLGDSMAGQVWGRRDDHVAPPGLWVAWSGRPIVGRAARWRAGRCTRRTGTSRGASRTSSSRCGARRPTQARARTGRRAGGRPGGSAPG